MWRHAVDQYRRWLEPEIGTLSEKGLDPLFAFLRLKAAYSIDQAASRSDPVCSATEQPHLKFGALFDDRCASSIEYFGMAAERAGRRARCIKQHGVEWIIRFPFQRVRYHRRRLETGARKIVGKSGQTTFGAVESSDSMSRGGELHGLAAWRSTSIQHPPSIGRHQPGRKRGGQVLDPPAAVAKAGQIGDRPGMRNAAMKGSKRHAFRESGTSHFAGKT